MENQKFSRKITLRESAKLGLKSYWVWGLVVEEEVGRLGPDGVSRGAGLHDQPHHARWWWRVDQGADGAINHQPGGIRIFRRRGAIDVGWGKLANESLEEFTPSGVVGWIKFEGKGDMSFDIDCGERGSEAGGRRWRKSSDNICSQSRSSLSIIIHGRDNGEERVTSGEEGLGKGMFPSWYHVSGILPTVPFIDQESWLFHY